MPTFPRSPLSFRTASFPQYGWKAGFLSGAFLGDGGLKPAPGDYACTGNTAIIWRDAAGDTAIWFMNGTTVASTGAIGNIPTSWTVQSTNAE